MSKVPFRISALLGLATVIFAAACGGSASENPAVISGSADVNRLQIIDQVEGTGTTASVGREVTVHYVGWLYDVNEPEFHGRQFDSTEGGAPFSFNLGSGEVISGWDQGIVGMRVGGVRTLIIPSGLGYGREGSGPIPPNSALVFDVALVDVN